MSLVSSIDIATALASALGAVTFSPASVVEFKMLPNYRPIDTESPRIVIRPTNRTVARAARDELECVHQVQVDMLAKLDSDDGETDAKTLVRLGEQVCAEIYKAGNLGGAELVGVVQEALNDSDELREIRMVNATLTAEYRSWGDA